MNAKHNNSENFNKMKACLEEADKMLLDRSLAAVKDLNYGDVSVFMESSLAFEVLDEIRYEDYPGFANLYEQLKKVDAFNKVHEPFLNFIGELKSCKTRGGHQGCAR